MRRNVQIRRLIGAPISPCHIFCPTTARRHPDRGPRLTRRRTPRQQRFLSFSSIGTAYAHALVALNTVHGTIAPKGSSCRSPPFRPSLPPPTVTGIDSETDATAVSPRPTHTDAVGDGRVPWPSLTRRHSCTQPSTAPAKPSVAQWRGVGSVRGAGAITMAWNPTSLWSAVVAGSGARTLTTSLPTAPSVFASPTGCNRRAYCRADMPAP